MQRWKRDLDSTLGLLKRLTEAGVDFVVVGGMAAAAYGSALVTDDVDVCVVLDAQNISRILRALEGTHPRQRMRPDRPPLSADSAAYVGFKNLHVVTDFGQLDFLGEITGIGGFAEVTKGAETLDLGGFNCRVVSLENLIKAKRTLARPKDLRAAAELEHVLARRGTRK